MKTLQCIDSRLLATISLAHHCRLINSCTSIDWYKSIAWPLTTINDELVQFQCRYRCNSERIRESLNCYVHCPFVAFQFRISIKHFDIFHSILCSRMVFFLPIEMIYGWNKISFSVFLVLCLLIEMLFI